MKIAIIVPFYNEENNLTYFINEWEKFLNSKKKISNVFFFYFINDGSTDNSVNEIKKKIKKLNYKIIDKKNSGHGDTCRFGYNLIVNKKKFDYLLQIDSDNQCDPKYMSKFYDLIKNKNYKFIFGFRKSREDGFLRVFISRILSLSILIKKNIYIKDLNTPYRLMNIKELKKILIKIDKNKKYKNISLFNCVLSYEIQKNNKISWIDIKFRKRIFGSTKYNFLDMIKIYTNLLIKI